MQVVLERYCPSQAHSHTGSGTSLNSPSTQQGATFHECAAIQAAEPSPVSVALANENKITSHLSHPPVSSHHVEHSDTLAVKRAHPGTTAETAPAPSPARVCEEGVEAGARTKKPRC
jgi:hypothetical protein